MTVQTTVHERLLRQMLLAEDVAARVPLSPAKDAPTGCVILDGQDRWLSAAATTKSGSHAEQVALRRANLVGPLARGGTAVVTMEPCRDCAEMLVRSGVGKVVYAVMNPLDDTGSGILLKAGVTVVGGVATGVVTEGVLRPWLYYQHHSRPYVTWAYGIALSGNMGSLGDAEQEVTDDLKSLGSVADLTLIAPDKSSAYVDARHVLVQGDPGHLLSSVNRVVTYLSPDFVGSEPVPWEARLFEARLVSTSRLGKTTVRTVWDIG